MWSTVSLVLVLLLLLPGAGVMLHVYLYRHQALLAPEPQSLSEGALQRRLQSALYATFGSEAEP
jgi:hypothetical protein